MAISQRSLSVSRRRRFSEFMQRGLNRLSIAKMDHELVLTPPGSATSDSGNAPSVDRAEVFGARLDGIDRTVWDMFSQAAQRHPDREAVVSLWQAEGPDGRLASTSTETNTASPRPTRLTYSDMLRGSEVLARWLHGLADVDGTHTLPGRRLAVYMWNSAEWAACFWAAARLGMVFVPLDPRTVADGAKSVPLVDPAIVVVQDAETAQKLDSANCLGAGIVKIQSQGQLVTGWRAMIDWVHGDAGDEAPLPAIQPDPSDTALIVFTSGTTSNPKPCRHTHRNLWSATHDYDAHLDQSQVDRWSVHTPTSHIFAINNSLRAWRVGSTIILPSRSFDVGATIRALAEERCTIMSAVPALARAIMAHPDFPGADKTNLDIVTVSATMIRLEDLKLCREALGARSSIQAYGMSEGAPVLSWNRQDPLLKDGLHEGVGKVLPGANIRVCEPGSRRVLAKGEVGELHIGGTTVIPGYLGEEGSESSGFYSDDAGNWLATGDQVTLDSEGVVRVLGRYKDLIIRAGENISPAQLEAHLGREGITAHVVGVRDDIAGQVPVAVVTAAPPDTPKTAVFAKALELGPVFALADVLMMKQDLGLDTLPMTSIGKVKKVELLALVERFLEKAGRLKTRKEAKEETKEATVKNETKDATNSAKHARGAKSTVSEPSLTHNGVGSNGRHERVHVPAFSQFPRDTTAALPLSLLQDMTKSNAQSAAQSAAQFTTKPIAPTPGATPPAIDATPLEEQLIDIWQTFVGVRPASNDNVSGFADSITILRVCDQVTNETGRRLHFTDVVEHNTIAAQARLLASRGDASRAGVTSQTQVDVSRWSLGSQNSKEPQPVRSMPTLNSAKGVTLAVVAIKGLVDDIEDVIPIRGGLMRLVEGPRPQSFHCRMVFRVFRSAAVVREALATALPTRPLMRTILAQNINGQERWSQGSQSSLDPKGACHVVMKCNPWLLKRVIKEAQVASFEPAVAVTQEDCADAHTSPFMFQAKLITMKDTPHTTIITLTYNHSIMDAMSLFYFHTDLDRLIHAPSPHDVRLVPLTPFKHFADLLRLNQTNDAARESVEFHVRRLRGISRCRDALWPAQRAPGWMIGNDDDAPLAEERAQVRKDVWDGRWDAVRSTFRYPRSSRVVSLPDVQLLRQSHGIEPSLLAKAALVLFNVLRTGTSYAVFNTWESGRKWPFVPPWMEAMMPPAMSVDGPTVEWVVNMIEVNRSRTVGEFLASVASHDALLSEHAHAPWDKVLEGLRDEADVAVDASYRQGFVWDVSVGIGRCGLGKMDAIARYDWPDSGIFWNAFMLDKQSMQVIASWDTAQMNEVEVDDHCDFYAEVLRKLAQVTNLDRPLRDVFN